MLPKDKKMNIHLDATDRTPKISLSTDPLTLTIAGESFPEDVSSFYGQIITTLSTLSSSVKGPLTFELEMIYINSSSIKAFYRIFECLDDYRKAGNVVNVLWKASEDDDIMQELGEDFKDRFHDLQFLIIQEG
jgi:hypothetical protein